MSEPSPASPYVCPVCRDAISRHDDGLHCGACERAFLVVGGVPLLVPQSDYVAKSYVEIWRRWREVARTASDNHREVARGATHPALPVIARGLEHNAAFLRSALDDLAPHVTPDDVLSATSEAHESYSYSDALLRYAMRDWGALPHQQREVRSVLEPVRQALASRRHERGRALVLGSGTGRFAWDVRGHFEEVDAVDLSFLMARTFERVRRGDVTLYDTSLANMPDDDAMCLEVPLSLAHAASVEREGVVRNAVADAGRLPFADGSFDVCLSLFFTDVMPLSQLAREVGRVLREGGLFLSIGPVNWHFASPRNERFSAAALERALGERGFVVEERRTHAVDFLASPSLTHLVYDTVVVAARWTGAAASAALTPTSRVAVEDGVEVSQRRPLRLGPDEDPPDLTLHLLDDREVAVSEPLVELLATVGEDTRVSDLCAAARAAELIEDDDDLVDVLRSLVDAGVLRIR